MNEFVSDAMHEATDQAEAVFVKRSKRGAGTSTNTTGNQRSGEKLLAILEQWLSSALETVTQLAQDANVRSTALFFQIR